MKHDQADCERAIQHVAAFEKLVTEQRERVVRLKANGSDAETAEYLLAALLKSLGHMKAYLATLEGSEPRDDSAEQ